jgi:type VI secretion system protein ImpJ
MNSPMVHWHEGMFVRPQHFQAAQRYWTRQFVDSAKWDHHHNWGLRSVDLDLEALANFRCVVRSLEARLRDGTLVVVSPHDPLPDMPLRGAFERQGTVTVYVGVPAFNMARPNAATAANGTARFVVETHDLADENTGLNIQSISLRTLGVKLLLSTQSLAGFEVVPVARLEKSSRAEAAPQVDKKYIPPVLACDAWKPLGVDILQAIYERVGKKVELLAGQVLERGLGFDSSSQGDAVTFNQLRELNQAYTTLGVLAFAQGIHPYVAYAELCRLVGQLAIFGPLRRPPELPVYDHDDLAKCFPPLKSHIDALLDVVVEPEYRERAFIGAGFRMQAPLEPAWMESSWRLFLGVRSPLPTDELVRLLTKAGGLDMKIGSSDRVDTIYTQGGAGLRFAHSPQPPQALPMPPGQAYFQVLREANDAEWQHVKARLSIAIRLNENLITGNIDGQRLLTIKHGGQAVPLRFTLYVLGAEKK